MPPGRRKSTQPTSTSTQRTLAFGPHPNKITKPNQAPPSSSLKKPTSSLDLPPKTSSLTPSPHSPPPPAAAAAAVEEIQKSSEAEANLAIREPVKTKAIVVAKSEAEERAARVGDGDVRRYWRKQEAARKAPRGKIFFFFFCKLHDPDFAIYQSINHAWTYS